MAECARTWAGSYAIVFFEEVARRRGVEDSELCRSFCETSGSLQVGSNGRAGGCSEMLPVPNSFRGLTALHDSPARIFLDWELGILIRDLSHAGITQPVCFQCTGLERQVQSVVVASFRRNSTCCTTRSEK
jgi:hypothetical protein